MKRSLHPARGMTLIEVLLATTIFLVVGVAMLAIFTAAVTLYRAGEASRRSSDEAMTVLTLLDRDVARAVPEKLGGHFRTTLDPVTGNTTAVGWLYQRPADDVGSADQLHERYGWVEWRLTGPATNATLERFACHGADPAFLDDPTQNQTGGTTVAVMPGLLHFGAWLVDTGTSDNLGAYPGYPMAGSAWQVAIDTYAEPDQAVATVPNAAVTEVSTIDHDNDGVAWYYPRGVRFTFIFAGADTAAIDPSRRRIGRLRGAVDATGTELPVAGTGALGSRPGTIVRIDDELLAIAGRTGGTLMVASDWSQGPIRPAAVAASARSIADITIGTGRGAWRSTATAHPRGSQIFAGEAYALVRRFD